MRNLARNCPDRICRRCKHYKYYSGYLHDWEECHAEHSRSFCYSHCWKEYPKPEVKNMHNDCPDFELKWWRKILHL